MIRICLLINNNNDRMFRSALNAFIINFYAKKMSKLTKLSNSMRLLASVLLKSVGRNEMCKTHEKNVIFSATYKDA